MNMLRSIREKKGLTLSQLAARASVPARVLAEYEEGTQPIPLPHAKLLAKALWVGIEELLPPAGSVPPAAYTSAPPQPQPQPRPAPVTAAPPAPTPRPMQETQNHTGAHVQQAATPRQEPAQSRPAETAPQRPRTVSQAAQQGGENRTTRPARPAPAPSPLTEGQLQELSHLSTRLEINQEQLEERLGKAIHTLTRTEAKDWIKRLRAMADEIAPSRKVRFGQWPEANEDREAAYLREQRDAASPFTFRLFNGEQITGTLTDFTPYTITVRVSEDEEVVLRKLAIAYYRRMVADAQASGSGATGSQPSESGSAAHEKTGINSDHAGVPDIPEQDSMDEDRGV
ncbi:MAG TPA: helix-turn-helix transcriptional regulator [Chloroflexia bacterium]|nr:helix-turn-helix transcriptional regulator [Chloroflexia bacterium]